MRAEISEKTENRYELCAKEMISLKDFNADFFQSSTHSNQLAEHRSSLTQTFKKQIADLISFDRNIFAYFLNALLIINERNADDAEAIEHITIAADGYFMPALKFLENYYIQKKENTKLGRIKVKIKNAENFSAHYNQTKTKVDDRSLVIMIGNIINGDYFDTFIMEDSTDREHVSYKALYYDKLARSICTKPTTKFPNPEDCERFYKGVLNEFHTTTNGYIESAMFTSLDPIWSSLAFTVPLIAAPLSFYYDMPVAGMVSLCTLIISINLAYKVPTFAKMDSDLLENELILTALYLTVSNKVFTGDETVARQACNLWFRMPYSFGWQQYKSLSHVVLENKISLNPPPRKQHLFTIREWIANFCYKKSKIKADDPDIESGDW